MKISVIGCGYLGGVHAAAMAEIGHEVVGFDVDPDRIAHFSKGQAPFLEPGLDELLERNVRRGALSFTTDASRIAGADVHFIAVGTPQKPGALTADLTYLNAAVETVVENRGTLIVVKSTVPVGTARAIQHRLAQESPRARVLWNPEFLREGHGVADTLEPDRIVYGLAEADPDQDRDDVDVLDRVYSTILAKGVPRLLMDYETAEMVKVAANSFLATKISFINAMAELCERTGADVAKLADAIGRDERIGPSFLRAGIGFGGGCLPKDIRAFTARAGELGAPDSLIFLREVDAINVRARERAVMHVAELLGGRIEGSEITVLGASFKPHSDDIRDSPALAVALELRRLGANVRVHDPAAGHNVQAHAPEVTVSTTVDDALHGAEAIVLGTEWPEYVSIDPRHARSLVAAPNIFDGRNALDSERWRRAGWNYQGMGR